MDPSQQPPPTDLYISCAIVNTLQQIEAYLVDVTTLLKQIAANTVPKK